MKSRHFIRFVLLLVFLATPLVLIAAQTGDFGDLTIKIEAITGGASGSGYEEYRAIIANHSTSQSHRVNLSAPASPNRQSGPMIIELKREVEVAPGTTANVSLLLPPLQLAGGDFSVTIDGRLQRETAQVNSARVGAWVRRVNNDLYVLVSQSVNKSGLMKEARVEEGVKNRAGYDDVAYLPYEFPLNEWSVNWLAYSRFYGIVLTGDDLRAAPEGVRSALWSYLQCGGALLVIGHYDPPKQWQATRTPISIMEETVDDDSSGKAPTVNFTLKPGKDDPPLFRVGFGSLVTTGSSDPKQFDPSQWQQIRNIWERSKPHQKVQPTLETINQDFTVVDQIGVPVRGLFLLMILFVIVIGPINLIWLAKRRKKLWLLWTAPLISLLTCLAVSAFAFFGEGLSSTSRTEAFTILDEVSHTATTIGWTAFYSPVTPGDGLHFSYDTELIPQFPGMWEYRPTANMGRSIDWTSDQHLTSGWLAARVPAYFKLRKSEMRRERMTTKIGADGSISVVNGLGANIRSLWWADREGKMHIATNIQAGALVALNPMNVEATGQAKPTAVYDEQEWLTQIADAEANPGKYLQANCYLAVLESSPFVEDGLRKAKTRKAKTLVYGIQAIE